MHCRSCGEEIIGAVNRCWKCDQPIGPEELVTAEEVTIDDEPVLAILVEEPLGEGPARKDEEPNEEPDTTSPFQTSGPTAVRAIRIPAYRNPYLGQVCSWIAVVLGGTSFFVSVAFPLGGAILAFVAMVVATIGMRTHAVRSGIGAVLCVLALISGGTVTALHHYAERYGRYPWQADTTPSPFPVDDTDFDQWE
jgi:hypothetical protein